MVISKDTFNEVICSLNLRYYRYYLFTTACNPQKIYIHILRR
jgi:hypothetical protein